MTETKCFRDAFRDQLHELSGQPNILLFHIYSNYLPEKTHDKMRYSFRNIFRMNIHHFAANTTSRINC